jgi:DNA-binding MarR family transcriptional regulator
MTESKSLKFLLFSLVKQAKRDIERQFAKAGISITPFQYGILVNIKHQPATLAEIAKNLGIKAPSALPYVDGLQKQGLIVRHNDAKDRRKIELKITPKGLRLIQHILKDRPTDILNKAFNRLSKQNQKQLMLTLKELYEKIT